MINPFFVDFLYCDLPMFFCVDTQKSEFRLTRQDMYHKSHRLDLHGQDMYKES